MSHNDQTITYKATLMMCHNVQTIKYAAWECYKRALTVETVITMLILLQGNTILLEPTTTTITITCIYI